MQVNVPQGYDLTLQTLAAHVVSHAGCTTLQHQRAAVDADQQLIDFVTESPSVRSWRTLWSEAIGVADGKTRDQIGDVLPSLVALARFQPAKMVFTCMLLIAELVLGRPNSGDVRAAFK